MSLLASLHRWLGVVLGLFFAMWFFTGMVMMYVPFPSLSDAERLSYLAAIDTAKIELRPAEAVALCGPELMNGLRVISIQDRPAYICSGASLPMTGVYADTGLLVPPLGEDAVASHMQQVMRDPVETIGIVEFDQWTVHQRFDALRPLYRVALADHAGTHFYVSSITGEIVQRTTSSQRFWNYLGAVAHWIYPTVLRKHWAIWDSVVWWLSGVSIVCAVVGVCLGITHWAKLRRAGKATLSPFSGWMKWHHILGLCTGIIVVSWIVSGWLSMDHGRLFSLPTATAAQKRAVHGVPLSEASASVSIEMLGQYPAARELTLHSFGGKARVVAKNQRGVVESLALEPRHIAGVVDAAFPSVSVERYDIVQDRDTYTHLREGQLPPGTVRVELSDPDQSWLHIDRHSGEILLVLDDSRRIYRWLFNGMHSLDVPGLVEARPLWDFVMLILLGAGFAASSTGVVIGWKRLWRTISN